MINNGVKRYNSTNINIEYVGGIDSKGKAVDNRTKEQKDTLVTLLKQLKKKYPNAAIMGHRDSCVSDNSMWKKMCPCFNAKEEYKHL